MTMFHNFAKETRHRGNRFSLVCVGLFWALALTQSEFGLYKRAISYNLALSTSIKSMISKFFNSKMDMGILGDTCHCKNILRVLILNLRVSVRLDFMEKAFSLLPKQGEKH